jgi:Ca-activated chloride channel homolog
MAGGGIVGVLMACACLALSACGGEEAASSPVTPIKHSNGARANVLVVVDVSKEMGGDRLSKARAALDSLVRSVPASDRIGLAVFADHFNPAVPVLGVRENRRRLASAIRRLQAGGHSAAYDATVQAYGIQRELASPQRQNTVLILAHSEDSASQSSLARVERLVGSQKGGPRVRVFTVAYEAGPALTKALAGLAKASTGKAFTATDDDVTAKLRRAWAGL